MSKRGRPKKTAPPEEPTRKEIKRLDKQANKLRDKLNREFEKILRHEDEDD